MSAATRSPLRSLRSLRGERATPLRVNSKPDTLCALKPDTSICPQHLWVLYPGEQEYPLTESITAFPLRDIGKLVLEPA